MARLPGGWQPCHAGAAVAPILSIWLLGDGKPGHENQALGLAEALARLQPCAIQRICLAEKRGLFSRLRAALQAGGALPLPDLVIAAGHATHPALLWLARQHHVPGIVLMRPSLPACWFDLCIAPLHDFKQVPSAPNILTTMGALNRVVVNDATPRLGGLILVGGPSGTHDWDANRLLESLACISGEISGGPWKLTDSRRTPPGFLAQVGGRLPELALFPHGATPRDWLPARLAEAAEVWVTEDSVSMVYEALSSGARVGLLPVPRKKQDTRVLRGLDRLVDEGFATPYDRWCQTRTLAAPPQPLREAERCAQAVLEKFFPFRQPC
jgi:mitochondrial fission protein ELM1